MQRKVRLCESLEPRKSPRARKSAVVRVPKALKLARSHFSPRGRDNSRPGSSKPQLLAHVTPLHQRRKAPEEGDSHCKGFGDAKPTPSATAQVPSTSPWPCAPATTRAARSRHRKSRQALPFAGAARPSELPRFFARPSRRRHRSIRRPCRKLNNSTASKTSSTSSTAWNCRRRRS